MSIDDHVVPLSLFALDYPEPPDGWAIELRSRAIPIVEDSIGRAAIPSVFARELLVEQRQLQADRSPAPAAGRSRGGRRATRRSERPLPRASRRAKYRRGVRRRADDVERPERTRGRDAPRVARACAGPRGRRVTSTTRSTGAVVTAAVLPRPKAVHRRRSSPTPARARCTSGWPTGRRLFEDAVAARAGRRCARPKTAGWPISSRVPSGLRRRPQVPPGHPRRSGARPGRWPSTGRSGPPASASWSASRAWPPS